MSDNIKVAIRVRPLISREQEKNTPILWDVTGEKCIGQVSPATDKFNFDRVFNYEEDNCIVYKDLCYPIVQSVMQGFNGTIFAYGQTASGKTYTMMGEHSGIIQGVLHYAITDVFRMIQDMPDREFLLRVSFIEIYNEKVYDLLSNKNVDLKIFEDAFGVVKVNGVEEKIVLTSEQIMDWMRIGLKKRRTGETQMNRASSRSHSIFRMIIESRLMSGEDAVVNVSQLNLVDLAGSENVKQTKTKGDRFKEGIHINLSLSTLSQVICQLSEKEDQFIKYRNSKLTRLLQNSLGGNALTAIICTVTPASQRETLSTLHFASRAKKIKNKPEKNEILTDQAMLRQYANKIKKLSQQLAASKEQGKELEEKTKQNETLKRQIEALKANFVTYVEPEKRNKAVRRETWGGRFDARRLQASLGNPLEAAVGFDLTTVEEEAEDELDFVNCKERRSSFMSPKRARYSGRKMMDTGTQTNYEMDNVMITAYDETMIMVSELRSQLTTLQTEYSQLNEYTTLEKQCLKAASEHLEEMQALKSENNVLKVEVDFLSKKESSPSSIYCKRCDSSVKEESRVSSNEGSKSNLQESRDSINSELNKAICLESSSSADSLKLSQQSEVSLKLDETGKSHFLAFYDECVDSEGEKLKEEIEALKRDNDWKDRQIHVLNDKLEELSKIKAKTDSEINEVGILRTENESVKYDIGLKDKQLGFLQGEIEKLREIKAECESTEIEKLRAENETIKCDSNLKDNKIGFLENEIKELCEKLKTGSELCETLKENKTTNFDNLKDRQITLLKGEIEEFNEMNMKTESEIKNLRIENDSLKYDNNLKDRQVISLKGDIKELSEMRTKTESNTREIKELRKENKTVKFDNNSKDEQIDLLKGEIKELSEMRTKSESETNEIKKLRLENETVKCDINEKDRQIDLLKGKIEELGEMNVKSESELSEVRKLRIEIVAAKHDRDLKDRQINLLNDKLEIKEQMISSLNDEITLNKTSSCVTCNKIDACAQTSMVECEIKIPGRNLSYKECQTSPFEISKFETISPKMKKSCIAIQTSPQLDLLDNAASPEISIPSNSDSDDGIDSRVSPLSLYLLDNEKAEKDKQQGKSWKDTQTTPMRFRGVNTQCFDHLPMADKFVQTSPITNSGRIHDCDCKNNKIVTSDNSVEQIENDFVDTSQKSAILFQNQSDELKILTNQLSDVRAYAFEFLKNCLEPVFMDDIEAPAACSSECLSSTAKHEITALRELIMRLESYVRDIKDHSELLNEQLESKFEEVISLGLKLSEAESVLNKKETEIGSMNEKIIKLKDSILELSSLCSMLRNVESQEQLVEMRRSSHEITDVQHKISKISFPVHNLIYIQNMVSILDSHVEENALQIIDLSAKLKTAENKLAMLLKERKEKSCNLTLREQTDFVGNEWSKDNQINETEKLVSQFENDTMQLKEKICDLMKCNKELKGELKDAEYEHSVQICALKSDHESAKSQWEMRTRKLVKDLEAKYDEEISDQEDKLAELRKQHLRELGQKEVVLKNSLAEMKSLHNKELLAATRTIAELSEKNSKIFGEKLLLRSQLENENREVVSALKGKHVEEIGYWKKKWDGVKDLFYDSDMKNKLLDERIKELESKIENLNENPELEQVREKMDEISRERDMVLKKYTQAMQNIHELKQEMKSGRHEIIQKVDNKETEELKKLLNELDQRKAKIMTLETNNSSMVKEIKKLREMLSSKTNLCPCKTSTTSSKSVISANCDYLKVAKNKSDPKIDPEAEKDPLVARNFKADEHNHDVCDSREENADQDKILCMGGSSGPANMVKCYWLEGKIYEKDKELSELRKKIADLTSEVKSLRSCPVLVSEKKKESDKREPVHILFDDDTSGNVTVANAAFHPYRPGSVPKVQPKQILKERNRMTSGKPYDWLKTEKADKANAVTKVENPAANVEERRKYFSEPISDVEAAKFITGQSECKQQ